MLSVNYREVNFPQQVYKMPQIPEDQTCVHVITTQPVIKTQKIFAVFVFFFFLKSRGCDNMVK